ncbi:MAG: hypothetical protein Fues2KO_48170 [Fuerstiella sp.]
MELSPPWKACWDDPDDGDVVPGFASLSPVYIFNSGADIVGPVPTGHASQLSLPICH